MAPAEEILPPTDVLDPVDPLRPEDGLDLTFPGPSIPREGVGEEEGGVRGEGGEG